MMYKKFKVVNFKLFLESKMRRVNLLEFKIFIDRIEVGDDKFKVVIFI